MCNRAVQYTQRSGSSSRLPQTSYSWLVWQATQLRPPQRTAVLSSPSCASFRQIHQSASVLLRSCLSPSTQRSLLVVGAANTPRLVALLPVTVDTVLSTRGRRRKTRRAAQMPALPAPSPPAVSCPLDPLDAGKAAKKRYTKPLDGSRSSQKQPYGVVPVAAIGSSSSSSSIYWHSNLVSCAD